MGVSYKLEGSDTILVSRDLVHQTRLDLSAKGMPADGAPGYDLLDDQGITTSEFKQRIDYQRALERSEEHTSELQSLMRTSYAVFCLKKKKQQNSTYKHT